MSTDGLNDSPSPADKPGPDADPHANDLDFPGELSDLDRPGAPSELDYEADPLLRLERNNKSTRQAIRFFIGVIVSTTLSAILIWVASKAVGGPYCEADSSAQLCSRTFQLLFAIVPTSLAFFSLFGSAFITYYKWKKHQRWRPWVAVIWFIMPFCMAWITSVGAYLILDHNL